MEIFESIAGVTVAEDRIAPSLLPRGIENLHVEGLLVKARNEKKGKFTIRKIQIDDLGIIDVKDENGLMRKDHKSKVSLFIEPSDKEFLVKGSLKFTCSDGYEKDLEYDLRSYEERMASLMASKKGFCKV